MNRARSCLHEGGMPSSSTCPWFASRSSVALFTGERRPQTCPREHIRAYQNSRLFLFPFPPDRVLRKTVGSVLYRLEKIANISAAGFVFRLRHLVQDFVSLPENSAANPLLHEKNEIARKQKRCQLRRKLKGIKKSGAPKGTILEPFYSSLLLTPDL